MPAAPDALKHRRLADRLDGLAGMAWAYSVLHFSGMSARSAGIYFTPAEHLITAGNGYSADSGVFNYYLKGTRKPVSGPRGKNGVDLIAAVGREEYGSRANSWLEHPLWKIFSRNVSQEYLAPFCAPEKIPLHIVPYLFAKDLSAIPVERAPRILRARDFLYVCAFYRAFHAGGYPSTLVPLIRYLVPQVCSLDPIFGYIHAPFMRMLEDNYFKTDEQVLDAWPVEEPPCFDPKYSEDMFEDAPCPLNGTGKAKHVCERCEIGGGLIASEFDWDT